MALLGAAAFWVFDALPFQDLPAHIGVLAMRARFPASAFEQRYYARGSELGPYAVFLLVGDALAPVVGPGAAIRSLASLPVLATPAALLYARRRLHGDTDLWAGFLGVGLSFGFMTLLGLASYLLGLAGLVVGLTIWLELAADVEQGAQAGRRELLLVAASLGLALAHGFAFAILGGLAAATCVAGAARGRRALRLRAFAPGVLLVLVSALRGGPPAASAGTFALVPSVDYQGPLDKLSLLLTPTLLTRWGVDVLLGLAVWGTLLASLRATLRARGDDPSPRSRMHVRGLGVAAAAAAGMFLALPHAFRWFGFIDGRLVPVLLFALAMGVRRPALGPRLDGALRAACASAAVGMVGIVLVASWLFQAEARGYREVLAKVPAGAFLLNLPVDPDSAIFTAHPFVHYDKLAAVSRDVVPSDVWADRATALYATPENPQTRLPAGYSSARIRTIDWPAFRLEDWSHVLVRTRPGGVGPDVPPGLTLVDHEGGFWLYARTAP